MGWGVGRWFDGGFGVGWEEVILMEEFWVGGWSVGGISVAGGIGVSQRNKMNFSHTTRRGKNHVGTFPPSREIPSSFGRMGIGFTHHFPRRFWWRNFCWIFDVHSPLEFAR